MMRTRNDPEQTRARLLEAAGQVVLKQGLQGLTLDAVAQAAGVSKGGLLYHYPSKETLVKGLFAHLLEEFERDVERRIDPTEPPGTPGRYTRAYIAASFSSDERQRELGALIGALVTADPELLTMVRASFERTRAAIAVDGLGDLRAALVQMATDGIMLYEMLGVQVLSSELCLALFEELMRLTREP
jgi:AcrR family transcriptional regulator